MTDGSHPSSGLPVCFHERQSKHWVLIGGYIAAVVAATAAAASHMQSGNIVLERVAQTPLVVAGTHDLHDSMSCRSNRNSHT